MPKTYAIPEEVLRQPLTSAEIAKRYGCAESTVQHKRRALGIAPPKRKPLLPPRIIHRTAEERAVFGLLVECYDKARKEGVDWQEFLGAFRRTLPAMMEHLEYDDEWVRLFGGAA